MLSLKCLGTGKGATNFFTGEPSTAYILLRNEKPVLLLDCGAGVGRSLIKHVGHELPRHIYISHNHSDHTADLPVYMSVQHAGTGDPIELYGHGDVLKFVADHRLHELNYINHPSVSMARWHAPNESGSLQAAGLDLELLKSVHSYLCYGFLAKDAFTRKPILGWSADSKFEQGLYDRITKASTVILHGRAVASKEHASFEQIESHASKHPDKKFYVAHHETSTYRFTCPNVGFLKAGDQINLGD